MRRIATLLDTTRFDLNIDYADLRLVDRPEAAQSSRRCCIGFSGDRCELLSRRWTGIMTHRGRAWSRSEASCCDAVLNRRQAVFDTGVPAECSIASINGRPSAPIRGLLKRQFAAQGGTPGSGAGPRGSIATG